MGHLYSAPRQLLHAAWAVQRDSHVRSFLKENHPTILRQLDDAIARVERRPSLQSLRRSAAQSTRFRGHRMRWQVQHGEYQSLAIGTCQKCEMQVTCNTRPEPNQSRIAGEAVALTCPGVLDTYLRDQRM